MNDSYIKIRLKEQNLEFNTPYAIVDKVSARTQKMLCYWNYLIIPGGQNEVILVNNFISKQLFYEY